jgi:hypothetical protein
MKVRDSLSPELAAATSAVETLDRELARALAADPNQRHASTMDLWSALEPALRAALDDVKPPPRSHVSPYETTARADDPPMPPIGSGIRVREATPAHAANPAAWAWSIVTPAIGARSIRRAAFTKNGDAAIALGAAGLLRWDRGSWIPSGLPNHLPAGSLRGLRWMRDGSVLLFGEGGFVGRHVLGGGTTVWRVPDPEVVFLDALVEDNGTTTLVGERPYRGTAPRPVSGKTAGVVAQFQGDRLSVVGDALHSTRLNGVARLTSGQLVACGDWGAIVRVELGVVEFVGSVCAGHLLSIAPLPDGGAVTVGGGGHALALGLKLEAQLEAVQTTRDLLCVATSEDGQAWAGSAQARLVRRASRPGSNSWARMTGEIGVTSSMLAIAVAPRSVRAVGDDGTVVEGRLA